MIKYLINFFFKLIYFVSILLLVLKYFYDRFSLNFLKFPLLNAYDVELFDWKVLFPVTFCLFLWN